MNYKRNEGAGKVDHFPLLGGFPPSGINPFLSALMEGIQRTGGGREVLSLTDDLIRLQKQKKPSAAKLDFK